jgi:hypothetical protein
MVASLSHFNRDLSTPSTKKEAGVSPECVREQIKMIGFLKAEMIA